MERIRKHCTQSILSHDKGYGVHLITGEVYKEFKQGSIHIWHFKGIGFATM
jgi:hypothetical protein